MRKRFKVDNNHIKLSKMFFWVKIGEKLSYGILIH